MFSPCPLLVANETTIAARIRSTLSERSGADIRCCDYASALDQIDGRQKVLLLAVLHHVDDIAPATTLLREIGLRQDSAQTVVIDAGGVHDRPEAAELRALADRWHRWPEAAGNLVRLLAAPTRNGQSQEATLPDRIQQALQLLTPSLTSMATRLSIAAQHDVTVLLTGETGTGKTFLGKLLHDHSPRSSERLLIVPCGAQPAELFESAFFGHVKGSFTGAHQTQPGKFANAGKGTILLDEIDTLGFEQQAALLRVIESGEYEMVGSSQTLKSEARLIVTCNKNLEDAVQRGEFRQDLFYRLNVMAFHLPPLRERVGDIPMLARGFVSQFAAKYNKPVFDITPAAQEILESFSWPGNVRQLENVIQQAVLICRGDEITADDLPEQICGIGAPDVVVNAGSESSPKPGDEYVHRSLPKGSLLRSRTEYERALIVRTLEACQQNRSSAARALGVSRVTLHKKIKQYGLKGRPPI